MDNNRKTAFYILRDIKEKKSYSNIAINRHFERNKLDSPAFVRELVYGTLKNLIKIDYILDKLLKDPVEKTDISSLVILRMGIYQIIGMGSVPDYAAVDESVKLAKKVAKGRDTFINGVLRTYLREKDNIEFPTREDDFTEYLSVEYSFRPWIIELWIRDFGEENVEDILKVCNETPELTIRVNTLKVTRPQLIERLKEKGIESKPSDMTKETLNVGGGKLIDEDLYRNGFYSIQDDSSYLAVKMLDPKPGDTVIDTCAAPGGKSLAIAEKMNNKGNVISLDISKRKLKEIDANANRLGVKIVKSRPWDSRRAINEYLTKADKVIVDAPCSALGLIRKKPEIKYKEWSHEMAIDFHKTQLDILKSSARYLKPGGTLVYCTCTLNKTENQDIIKRFLWTNTSFKKEKDYILLPNINHTNGFYICKLVKSGKITAE